MTRIVLILLAACSLFAQTPPAPAVSIGGPTGMQKAGSTVSLSVNLTGTGTSGLQALQFSLPGLSWTTMTADGAAITGISKSITCKTVGTAYNCIVAGVNSNLLADGQLATLQVQIPKSAPGGTLSLLPTGTLGARTDATGGGVGAPVVAGSPFALGTTSACDLDGNGKVDITDLTIGILQVLQPSVCSSADLDSSGACDVVDAQILANAAAGGVCKAK